MIEPISGVLVDVDDAHELVRVIDAYGQLLAESHRRPSARLTALRDRLSRAETRVTRRNTPAGARKPGSQQDSEAPSVYDVIDTGQAAALLGITADGVRDLARRGRIPARKIGGRWCLDAAAVSARSTR
ncbi:helix-turn-helix domain-containing protein [Gordonia sp. CPCC 206044]|uniref:helix-turn-helix domain-containing protein n=1 Tax=Gordonia sp. CPCC 206044 TaxID=3140793 RepID=UPI003AF3A74F